MGDSAIGSSQLHGLVNMPFDVDKYHRLSLTNHLKMLFFQPISPPFGKTHDLIHDIHGAYDAMPYAKYEDIEWTIQNRGLLSDGDHGVIGYIQQPSGIATSFNYHGLGSRSIFSCTAG